jgi:NAD(P)-dependent dehydrogenase (short-subunit alcohol dehydrogenase family)
MSNKKIILVAGATGNIGKAAAIALAKRGAKVVMLGRSLEKLKSKVDQIHDTISEVQNDYQELDIEMLKIDFSNMESVRLAVEEAMKRFPVINGLVLSVGAFIQNGPNILPSRHELMFATNVMGPFLFTQLLLKRIEESDGLILHVIAPFEKKINWDDLESIRNHRAMNAFNRTKTCNRVIAGELARRYAGKISSVAFDPAYVIDKSDPELYKRWPSGLMGFLWRMMTIFFAKPPMIAGEPIADLMLSHLDRKAINGALFKLYKRIEKPDKAMNDEAFGRKLWDELVKLTELVPD